MHASVEKDVVGIEASLSSELESVNDCMVNQQQVIQNGDNQNGDIPKRQIQNGDTVKIKFYFISWILSDDLYGDLEMLVVNKIDYYFGLACRRFGHKSKRRFG